MFRSFAAVILLLAPASGLTTMAQPGEDDVVRLPGSGEVKSENDRAKLKADRLKPGGGLLASFDTDGNGKISEAEIQAGVALAFEAADDNGDGELTALEQQAWAQNLPTRDDSLANPVRFDPNLDRRVSYTEFQTVIIDLASDYRKQDTDLKLASLKAPKREANRERERIDALIDRAGNPPANNTTGSDF
ncbi:MAG: EF-hand domain-containing protein [Henriciella sp.]|uniref:hypothetical protein n=1 Tax=Henriciella sp. TaxID=1968823 RepID=UPI003C780809